MQISRTVRDKLRDKHGVTINEVRECFENRVAPQLIETRPNHVTNPPSQWFLARTNHGRLLKVVFIMEDGEINIKTAYEPEKPTIDYYTQKVAIDEADL